MKIKKQPLFLYTEKEPQRPYDQNGGSIAPRSLIFDPIAKEKSKIIANRGIAKKLKSQRLQVKQAVAFRASIATIENFILIISFCHL